MPAQAPRSKHWSTHVPEGSWDYVIIGSGMGGMTCAAMLAKMGRRVLVLEQHYEPGGFTHTFKRPGYRWDVGVHAVGEVTERSLPGRLLRHLTDDDLRWASLGEVYDEFYYPDRRLDFPDSPALFRHNLLEAFPREAKAIDAYLALAREVAGAMKGYYLARALPRSTWWAGAGAIAERAATRHLRSRTAEVISGLTEDPELRAVLVAQWGYYGSPPSRSSFAMQALVTRHFLHGGYYPVGGSQQIAGTLLRTVANAGGWTTIRAGVERVRVENGRAVGVELSDGRLIRAGQVVSAAGVLATTRRLLDAEHAAAPWARSVGELEPAAAHVCLYLGFRGDIRRAGAGSANKWFYETWEADTRGWMVTPDGALPRAPILYTSFPSLKDPSHDGSARDGESAPRHTGEVVTFVPWEAFDRWQGTRWHRRGDDYARFKQAMTDRLLEQLYDHMPGLRGMVEHAELSTPLSTDHFVRPMAGSIYGLEPTPARFANPHLRPRSPIPGLLLTGSEITTVGVIGAMMGGVLTAVSAEPVRGARLLRQVG